MFEVIYHYHEEVSKGEYNREETKTRTTKVGTPYEDVPLEILASKIMSQLARRNILVVDVEVYEYTKKKLNYRETSDGIVIKNKKFKFDDGPVAIMSEAEETPEDKLQKLLANPNVQRALQGDFELKKSDLPKGPGPAGRRVIRKEVFKPEEFLLRDAEKRGLAFTVGKSYSIYHEAIGPGPVGMLYEVSDNNGRILRLSDKFFVPDVRGLGEFEDNSTTGGTTEEGLTWKGLVKGNDVPNVRAS